MYIMKFLIADLRKHLFDRLAAQFTNQTQGTVASHVTNTATRPSRRIITHEDLPLELHKTIDLAG